MLLCRASVPAQTRAHGHASLHCVLRLKSRAVYRRQSVNIRCGAASAGKYSVYRPVFRYTGTSSGITQNRLILANTESNTNSTHHICVLEGQRNVVVTYALCISSHDSFNTCSPASVVVTILPSRTLSFPPSQPSGLCASL
jgi:hypothetical protein